MQAALETKLRKKIRRLQKIIQVDHNVIKNNSSHNISHSDVADELDYVQPYVADEHKQHKLSLCFISKVYCLCTHKYNGNSRTSLPTKQEAATRKR